MPTGVYIRKKPIWNKGKKYPQITGNKNHMWKGSKVGYHSLHDWVIRNLGIPKECSDCGAGTTFDTIGRRKIHWANKSHKYKRLLNDWISLCIKCHRKYDNHPFFRKKLCI